MPDEKNVRAGLWSVGIAIVVGAACATAPSAAATTAPRTAAARSFVGVDWRTADVTDIAHGDGTYTAVLSAVPVNYRTADGAWTPIDDTLVADPDHPGTFTNRADAWHVSFGPTSSGVRVDTGSSVLVMRPRAGRTVAPTVSGNVATYRDVWSGTDLRYTVDGSGLHESVLLKTPAAAAAHEFSLLSGPSAFGTPIGSARVLGGSDSAGLAGSSVRLSTPAVVAHDGSISSAAGAALTALPTGAVRLSISPAWLAAQPASAFPIDVDPSISLSYTSAHSYKSDGYTCANCGVQFGNAQDGGDTIWRSVAHYDYEQLFGDTVTAASFSISYVQGTTSAYTAYVHHASAQSYAGAAAGSALASGSLNTGKLTGSALTSALASWVTNRTSGAYFGFTGNETSGLYTYQKDTTTLSITYTKPAVPGAPRSVSATAGNASAKVSFSAPSSSGGSPITKYTVTASPGGRTATGTGSPITVTGLTNGTTYTFTVKATNSVGTGPASAASNAVTPATVPGAPRSVSATAGDASAKVGFSAPSSNGGAAVTKYTVTASPGGKTATGSGSPITVSGLTNGTSYTFTVTATNSVGTGPASAASNAVTPKPGAGVPGAPTSVSATGGDASAKVSFSAPSSDGGSPITSYTVTSSPGGKTASGSGSPITVSGLTNGTSYTFTVTATNSVGTGPASAASNAVTPQGGGGRPVPNQARGWDVDATVDADQVSCMQNAGYSFSMLYTNISETDWQTTYSAMKADGMYAVLQQGFGDGTMYEDPSQASTVADANIASAQSVSYPQGADFFLDVEQTGSASEQDVIDWINTWAAKIKAAGYTPGVYSGQPSPLTDSDLSSSVLPDVTVYWESESSSAPDPAQGYVAVQDLGTTAVCNIGSGVDTDTAYYDMNHNYLVGT